MKEFVYYVSLHRRRVSSVLADIATATMLAASIGLIRNVPPESAQFWVATMFAVCFIGSSLVVRWIWGRLMRKLDKWERGRYIYLHPQPIDPDATYYAWQIIVCYVLIFVLAILAIIFEPWTEEQMINAYVIATILLAVSACASFITGLRQLYRVHHSL